jgi:diketogulonate reductase-like aldo/keto reductase
MSSAATIPHVKKADIAIPRIGLGTWQLRGEVCTGVVEQALRRGYRHIDTAQGYANEAEVGEGLANAGVSRDEVFLTTKVRPDNMGAGRLHRSVEESLEKLRTDRVDLLLLHWPNPKVPLAETIPALNAVKREGLARAIGLSNFPIALLDEAWRLTTEPLAAEQIELHPFLDQRKMRAAIAARDMALIAYCPIALGRVTDDPAIRRIAKAHGRTPAQVSLRWLMQMPDVVAIPKTSKIDRLVENLSVFDFELGDEDMAAMNALTRPGSRLVDEPQWVAQWD